MSDCIAATNELNANNRRRILQDSEEVAPEETETTWTSNGEVIEPEP